MQRIRTGKCSARLRTRTPPEQSASESRIGDSMALRLKIRLPAARPDRPKTRRRAPEVPVESIEPLRVGTSLERNAVESLTPDSFPSVRAKPSPRLPDQVAGEPPGAALPRRTINLGRTPAGQRVKDDSSARLTDSEPVSARQRPGFSPVPISSVPSAAARRVCAEPGRSGFCWLSCGAQPESQMISKVARMRPSWSAKRCA